LIRLIATDLDDTLLNEEWKISEGNARAIRRSLEKGVKVTVATGRMAVSAREYARELGLDIPIITYHGALIEQSLSREVLYRKAIPSNLAAEILGNLQDRRIYTQVHLKDRVFTNASRNNEYSELYHRMTGIEIEKTDYLDLLQRESDGVEKIICIAEEEVLEDIADKYKKIYEGRVNFTSSRKNFLEIIDKEVNKATALKALADRWGIRREEIMALGDSPNDREMIIYAGVGVAVENAHPEIRKVADYITCSNREDGVARAIERFVLTEG